jgi:quercetin dioxygenase-like cupin family protein
MRTCLVLAGALVATLAMMGPVRADKVMITKDVTAEPIEMGDPSQTVIGQPLVYPKGKPVMKAYKITIQPGKATSLHLHQVPIFAYILSGTLEVAYGPKGKKRYKAGDGFMEAVNWCHRGTAGSTAPVVLVALYLGAPDLKNSEVCKE